MPGQSLPFNTDWLPKRTVEDFFIDTGFYDLLPLALEVARNLGYDQTEIIEAVCKVYDKSYQYPPTKNRTAWFKRVFEEKLREARGDILTYKAKAKYSRK